MAEIELSVFERNCLGHKIGDVATWPSEHIGTKKSGFGLNLTLALIKGRF